MSHKGSAFGPKSLAYNFFRFVGWLGGFRIARPVWVFGDGLYHVLEEPASYVGDECIGGLGLLGVIV